LNRLRAALRAQSVQIVHSHSGRAHNKAWMAKSGLNIRFVATRHVAFEPRFKVVHWLKYGVACDRIIAVSQAVRERLIESGVPSRKIEVIYTGVALPRTIPTADERAAARASFGLGDSDFVLGHLGAFSWEKGQDAAVQALNYLTIPNVRLMLAGANPPRFENPRVVTPGYVEDRRRFFAALDLFVMPSRSEAWGLAALEAMAHGVPVVASAVGGLKEIVEDGVSGWLVPGDDPRALAGGIEQARPLLKEFGGRARARAAEFSVEETVRRTEALYLSL
jgi:glycosyltransferase involved in cell wall biosynthesis